MGGKAELGDLCEPVIRKLVLTALGLWVARWLAVEVAGYLGYVLPPRPAPLDSSRPPGWMPRRLDKFE